MHIHISYPELFGMLAIAGGIYWYSKSHKKVISQTPQYINPDSGHYDSSYPKYYPTASQTYSPGPGSNYRNQTTNWSPAPTTAHQYASPVATAPIIVNNDSGNGLVTGMLMGELMAGSGRDRETIVEHETVIHDDGRTSDFNTSNHNYVDTGSWGNSSSDTPSSSSDSGGFDFSLGGSDSSSSSDSGGIDFSIGC